MKFNARILTFFTAQAAGLLLAGNAAWADPAETASASAGHAFRLDEVTVTSTKMDKNLAHITDSVTVVDEEQIKESGLTDMSDVLRFTPDIGFKRAGGPGQYVYTNVRGFNDGHFAVVIDGMKINESMSAGTGHLFSKLDPFLMQRIEVLRGPQASLYGSDTTAGVIAFTTKGGLPESTGTVGAEYGSYDWMKGYAGFRGQQDGLRYAVNAIQIDSGGVQDHEDYQNFSPQMKLGYNWGDKLDAELSYLHIQSKWNYSKLIEQQNFVKSRADWYAFQVPDPDRYNK
jgi:outer membrane cobalamin receptor